VPKFPQRMDPLRILIFHHRAADASNLRPAMLGDALAARGHDVTIVGNGPGHRSSAWATSHGAKVRGFPVVLGHGIEHGYDPLNTWLRLEATQHATADIVHAFDSRPAVILPALRAVRRLHVPLVLDWADLLGGGGVLMERSGRLWAGTFGRIESWFEEHYRLRAAAATVISSALESRLRALGFAGPILLSRHGCDPEAVKPIDRGVARAALGLNADTRYLVHVGTLRERNARLLRRAVELVHDSHRAELLLVGGSDPRIDWPESVRRPGRVSYRDLQRFIAASDLALLPEVDSVANRHRWPSKANDYFMLAKPVVATDVGDIATVLRERSAGVVTAPEAETFAAGIGSLLEDPERAATLGANGRRLAETDLDWRRLAEALEQLYRTAVSSTALPNRYRMRAVEQA